MEEPEGFFEIFDAEHEYHCTSFFFDGHEIKVERLGLVPLSSPQIY